MKERIAELRALKPGWYEGEGDVPTAEGWDWLEDALAKQFPGEMRQPFIFPTIDGNVLLEWSSPKHDVELEIDTAKKRGQFWEWKKPAWDEVVRDYDLTTQQSWQEIVARVQFLIDNKNIVRYSE